MMITKSVIVMLLKDVLLAAFASRSNCIPEQYMYHESRSTSFQV